MQRSTAVLTLQKLLLRWLARSKFTNRLGASRREQQFLSFTARGITLPRWLLSLLLPMLIVAWASMMFRFGLGRPRRNGRENSGMVGGKKTCFKRVSTFDQFETICCLNREFEFGRWSVRAVCWSSGSCCSPYLPCKQEQHLWPRTSKFKLTILRS